MNWYLIYAYALALSFGLSTLLTWLVRRLAIRWRILDHPGERKMQSEPVPLMGGLAIFSTFVIVLVVNLALLEPVRVFGFEWLEFNVLEFLGRDVMYKLIGLVAGSFIIFSLGIVDDIYTLNPEKKLIGQVLAAFIVVLSGIRLDLFLGKFFFSEWAAVAASVLLTMFWIILLTNSMNFLDNMDGLSGGVAVIAALSLFLCLMPQDTFVCVLLAVFAGAVAGFLIFNLHPARIYMGDAGSMFCGFFLSVAAILATFYTPDTPSRVAILAPLVALSVPLFDTASVIYIRLRRGESIMKGDKRHFSHRLVDLGMTPIQAVGFIFLVATVTGFGAILLRQVNVWGAAAIIAQTLGLFSLIVILMNAKHENGGG
jgi:UDP-GlcNAc:undecaprenyl-phosphate GlcNAc-1-phosphate transferase